MQGQLNESFDDSALDQAGTIVERADALIAAADAGTGFDPTR